MLLPHGTIVALVDGEKFELLRNGGNEAAPVLLRMDAPKLDEHNKNTGARHISSSANPDRDQLGEDLHAAAVADWLSHQVSGRHVEHVVVIAAPRTLGEMRRHYSAPLTAALVGELHKELIGSSGQEILAALQGK